MQKKKEKPFFALGNKQKKQRRQKRKENPIFPFSDCCVGTFFLTFPVFLCFFLIKSFPSFFLFFVTQEKGKEEKTLEQKTKPILPPNYG